MPTITTPRALPKRRRFDVYDIPGAPAIKESNRAEVKNKKGQIISPARTIRWNNTMALVLHAHRNDDIARSVSSSKLKPTLVQHTRHALEDTRPHDAAHPLITYGTIYGHFKMHPEHPSLPGKAANRLPVRPPPPEDPSNANPGAPDFPSGSNPMGHPHSSIDPPIAVIPHPPRGTGGGNPGSAQKVQVPATNITVNKTRPAAKTGAVPPTVTSAPRNQRPPSSSSVQPPSTSYTPRTPSSSSSASSSRIPSSSSSRVTSSPASRSSSSSLQQSPSFKTYQKLPRMNPYDPVPPPSAAAVKSAKDLYLKLKTTFPDLAADFEKKYDAWKKTWFAGNDSANSATRATGPEFSALVALGPKIVPFVVYRLTNGSDFMAIELCKADSTIPKARHSTQAANVINRQQGRGEHTLQGGPSGYPQL